jgi:pyruvate formate lyase activating enzyme
LSGGPAAPEATGTIFDVQPYAVHDGPGIRTLVFLKGCPLACPWCCNPESQAFAPDLRHEAWRCLACLRCVEACPAGAMAPVAGKPVPDRGVCADCPTFACAEACPGDALRRVGRPVTAEEVVAEVARDLDFFRNSGGGVTFSGGEPFAQPAFLRRMLALCREKGISTAVETCGHVSPRDLEAAEPLVDLFLFDLKVMDPVRHEALAGRDNALILQNLAWLAARAPEKVVVRHAVIPGFTDDPANHAALADHMRALGLRRLDLEPYHPMGEPKYEALGRTFGCQPETQALDAARMGELVTFFTSRGLACEVA